MRIVNPANGKLIKEVKNDTRESIHEKYDLARNFQVKWAGKSIDERIQCIRRFDELLNENTDKLAFTLTAEVGKPIRQAKSEIAGGRQRIQFFIQNSEKWLQEEIISKDIGITEKITYEPLGVIANISAWNYPYLVGINVFIPALIAGNSVLYKASEYSMLTGKAIEDLMKESGIPKGIFQMITGGKESGEMLLDLPIDGFFFTGSYETGKYIYEKVAKKMVPCQLELGGKDPMYISENNSNVARAAQIAAEGAFYNNGQSCCAVERIYVHDKIYDDFIKHFVAEVKRYKIGDPMDEETFTGPLTREAQIDVLRSQVEDALRKGASMLLGGKKIDIPGNYFEPTILTEVDHNMDLMKIESFGPIIGIQKVRSDDEAIEFMQDTSYGLTSSIITDSEEQAERIMQKIDSGTVYWNCCDRVSASLPWTGRKHSGIGTTLSYQGIRAFTQPKAYHFKKLV